MQMKTLTPTKRSGFTLVEVMVASAISVVVIGVAMGAFLSALQIWQQEQVKNELNLNLEMAMEWIRSDLRLSSVGVGLMAFYPPTSNEYTAISMPLAMDVNNDGLLDRGTDGKIIWNRTIVYHVRPGAPDQLIRTVINSRNTNATPAQIYAQLAAVVQATNDAGIAAACMTGESSASKIIFENLVNLKFLPPSADYDMYSPTRFKAGTYNWGSIVLDSGTHDIEFIVVAQDPDSSGKKIEIDKLTLSSSNSDRDAELFTPVRRHPVSSSNFTAIAYGGTLGALDRGAGQGWVGNAVLTFAPTGIGSRVKFEIYNDLWCDNNFSQPVPTILSNCSAKLDNTFTSTVPYIPDFVVTMDKGMAWTAAGCGDSKPVQSFATLTTITNYIYGSPGISNYTIGLNGRWAKVHFERAAGYSLLVTNARLIDVGSGRSSNLTFNGKNWFALTTNSPTQTNSDWVPMWEIAKQSNYMVRFQTFQMGFDNDLDMFTGMNNPGRIRFYQNTGSGTNPVWAAPVDDWKAISVNVGPAPFFADINGDGAYDLFIGDNNNVSFYQNTGNSKTPNFPVQTANWPAVAGGTYWVPVVADIDGDGLLDYITGRMAGDFVFVKNVGTPVSPLWDTPVYSWKLADGLTVGVNAYSAPELADIDGDGDFDLFSGSMAGGVYFWRNDGTVLDPQFTLVTNAYAGSGTQLYGVPRFADTDGDGDLDLYVGCSVGFLHYFQNTGNNTNASWAAKVTSAMTPARFTPAFVNIDREPGGVNGPSVYGNTDGITLSTVNGAVTTNLYGVYAVEVGYPRFARFRSGIYDTRMAAPAYKRMSWTEVQLYAEGGDVDVRVRTSDDPLMADVTDANFLTAYGFNNGYFQGNLNNNLVNLPKKRYVQYEALLECGRAGVVGAHTNRPTAVLRDLTIDWPGARGLVDLTVDFGRGPDLGIVNATVDGQALIKGVVVEMTIFKESRLGWNSASGMLEVRPLNTGK